MSTETHTRIYAAQPQVCAHTYCCANGYSCDDANNECHNDHDQEQGQ